MRIAWFTPLNKNSAIGKYSVAVTNSLKKYHQIDIWTIPSKEELDTSLNKIKYRSGFYKKNLLEYDLIVYNMGNNLFYHKDIYETSKIYPGVIILHDVVMHHFFTGYYFLHKKNTDLYIEQMKNTYGSQGKIFALKLLNGTNKSLAKIDKKILEFPLFEPAIEKAYGLITHSSFMMNKIDKVFSAPVAILNFPNNFNLGHRLEKNNRPIKKVKEKLILLSVGDINPNKRIDKIIEILGKNNKIAEKVIFNIVGSHNHNKDYLSYMKKMIAKYKLENVVNFLGFINDKELQRHIQSSDVCINLRYPSTEGFSASLIEQMSLGKCTITTNGGSFEDLPENVTLKINIDREINDLDRILMKIISNPDIIYLTGKAAYKYVSIQFSIKKYTKYFNLFMDQVVLSKQGTDLIDRVGFELNKIDALNEKNAINSIAHEIASITI